MTTALTTEQLSRRDQLEQTVKRGIKSFVETGVALIALRDEKLFADRFDSFEDYCKAVFGFTKQRGSQLTIAAEVAKDVATVVDIPNERVARELAKLDNPKDRRTAASIAVATAPDHKVTAEWMAGTVAVLQEAMATEGFVDTGRGGYAAINAGISHEVHQAMLEKRRQIQAKKQKPLAVFEASPSSIVEDCLSVTLSREQKHLLSRLKPGESVRFVIYSIEKQENNVQRNVAR